jgi:hypothetical protein
MASRRARGVGSRRTASPGLEPSNEWPRQITDQRPASMFLTDLQHAALQMLAKSPRGYALSTAVARGFSFEMLQGLVRVGYATTP